MSKEDYEKIQHLEQVYMLAHTQRYIRGIQFDEFDLTKSIYMKHINNYSDIWKINCGACVLDLYGRMYTAIQQYKSSIVEPVIDKIIDKVIVEPVKEQVKKETIKKETVKKTVTKKTNTKADVKNKR